MYIGALCKMRAGKCDEGKKLMREYLANEDAKRKVTDAELDRSVDGMARYRCPVSSHKSLADKAVALLTQMSEQQRNGDAEGCRASAEEAKALLKKEKPKDSEEKDMLTSALMRSAQCLAELERCADARKLWLEYYDLQYKGKMPPAEIRSTAEETFSGLPACRK
jgi:hypothetical protein